jgi:hypothetical protein
MGIFAVRFENPLDVPVQRPHDADPREHRRPRVATLSIGGQPYGNVITAGDINSTLFSERVRQ